MSVLPAPVPPPVLSPCQVPLPAAVCNVCRYNIDVRVGPLGVRLAVMRGGMTVLVCSGWSTDIAAAWASLGLALTPEIAEAVSMAPVVGP